VLLDLNQLGQGKKFAGVGTFVVSDDRAFLTLRCPDGRGHPLGFARLIPNKPR
jgi:hypothetical protein